jgi:hypothetical protein
MTTAPAAAAAVAEPAKSQLFFAKNLTKPEIKTRARRWSDWRTPLVVLTPTHTVHTFAPAAHAAAEYNTKHFDVGNTTQ